MDQLSNNLPVIIDTHSHLQFDAFAGDQDRVIEKTLAEHIWAINVGTNFATSKNAVALAEKYQQGLYSAIGLHPMYAGAEFLKIKSDPSEGEFAPENSFDKEKYRQLAASKKVVAVGEIGLDYYYKPKTAAKLAEFKEKQKRIFLEQLDFAKELGLPVILHCRMAHEDVIDILKSQITNHKSQLRGVVHCFTGTWEQAQKYMDLGFYLGINGIIFKFNIDQVLKNAPLEKIMVETDCPYLTPLPAIALVETRELSALPKFPSAEAGPNGYVRNEPIFIKHTIQKIAELKNISFDKVAEQTTQNARKLFRI